MIDLPLPASSLCEHLGAFAISYSHNGFLIHSPGNTKGEMSENMKARAKQTVLHLFYLQRSIVSHSKEKGKFASTVSFLSSLEVSSDVVDSRKLFRL